MTKIVNAVNANTEGAAEATTLKLDGGPHTVVAKATAWGGASAALLMSDDGGTSWYPIMVGGSAVAFTANGVTMLPALPCGFTLGAKVTGGTNIQVLTVEVI